MVIQPPLRLPAVHVSSELNRSWLKPKLSASL